MATRHQDDLEFFARCAGGFEPVLGDELRALRLRRVRPQVGGAIFFGSLADAYRACLWLRSATRVQLVLGRVSCETADALYQGVCGISWEQHVPAGATIAVDAHGTNPELRNTQFVALKVKDAICDRLTEVRGARPDVDPKDPDVWVNVAVHPRKATVYLNLSGASLHRRGYRKEGVQTEAPLKETLAAGILLSAGWPGIARQGGALVDPMCGSGTFAIEAALMSAQVAPGLLRTHWGFEGWSQHDQALWERVRDQARSRMQAGGGVSICAGDLDVHAIEIARANAARAGVADLIRFYVDDAARLKRHLHALVRGEGTPGLLVCNPPYGRRLLSDVELPQVNEAIAQAVAALPPSWHAVLLTPDTSVDTALGRVPEAVIDCHNGPLEVHVRRYDLSVKRCLHEVDSLSGTHRSVPIAEPGSAQFAARLRKVARERAKWARKSRVSCYRVYDDDLPDYPLTVDVYHGAGPDEGAAVAVVGELRRPASVDQPRADRRLADAAALTAAVLGIDAQQVVVHPWLGRREAADEPRPERRMLCVEEAGCRFVVDLSRRETGLPLAQRSVRDLVAAQAPGVRVAALFATSAPALVRTAGAGAAQTVAVDGSPEWLDGMRRQMETAGHTGHAHGYVCQDVRGWVRAQARGHARYDLVICCAPAWLPARDAGGDPWELAKDHVALVADIGRVLAPDGLLVLAFDDRDLRLDLDAIASAGLTAQNESGRVVPHDFERSHDAPRCFVLRRADGRESRRKG